MACQGQCALNYLGACTDTTQWNAMILSYTPKAQHERYNASLIEPGCVQLLRILSELSLDKSAHAPLYMPSSFD
jgi:hypothetical protein